MRRLLEAEKKFKWEKNSFQENDNKKTYWYPPTFFE